MRLVKLGKVFHIQIYEGKLVERGFVESSDEVRAQAFDPSSSDVIKGVDYHTLSYEKRAIDLDELDSPSGHVLTGARWENLTYKGISSNLNTFSFITFTIIFFFTDSEWLEPIYTSRFAQHRSTTRQEGYHQRRVNGSATTTLKVHIHLGKYPYSKNYCDKLKFLNSFRTNERGNRTRVLTFDTLINLCWQLEWLNWFEIDRKHLPRFGWLSWKYWILNYKQILASTSVQVYSTTLIRLPVSSNKVKHRIHLLSEPNLSLICRSYTFSNSFVFSLFSRSRLELYKPDVPTRAHTSLRIDSQHDQYIEFTNSDFDADAAQSTVPFIDVQPVVPSKGNYWTLNSGIRFQEIGIFQRAIFGW